MYIVIKKNKKKLIQRYLNNINLPNVLIHFRNIRIKKKIAKNIDKNEIIMIYLLTLNFLKQKKILLLNSEQGIDNLQKNIYKKLKEYKKMKISIFQSNYLPWKGYFDLINYVDIFYFLDNVEYSINTFRNRNKIKSKNSTFYLTVPLNHNTSKELVSRKR